MPRTPTVVTPLPVPVIIPYSSRCSPAPLLPSGTRGTSQPCSLRKQMRAVLAVVCFSSLSCSLEGENVSFPWHRQLGKKPFPVLVAGMVRQKACVSARSSQGAGCSPVCPHHLLWVLRSTLGDLLQCSIQVMLQLLLAISIFRVVSQIIKDSFCVLWAGGD